MLGGCGARFHAAVRPDGAVADAGWAPRRARAAIRFRDPAVLRFDDRQAHQPWRPPATRRGASLFMASNARSRSASPPIRRFSPPACGIPHSPQAKRPRRSSAGIATSCWRRAWMQLPRRRWRRCCFYVTDRHAPPWRSGRSLAATFPVPARVELDHGIHDLEIARERDGGYVASRDGREHTFEIDELGCDSHSLPQRRPCGIGKVLPRRRSIFISCTGASRFRSAISLWPRRPPRRRPAATARSAPR